MKQLLIILLLSPWLIQARQKPDFTPIDEASQNTPQNLTTHTEIARYLCRNLNTDIEKARAIYIWVSHNITYDFDLNVQNLVITYEMQTVDEALKKRKGLCQHYSDLFHAMASSVGLDSYVISGYTKDYNRTISPVSHAWNMLRINNNYYFVDATWAAGQIVNGVYNDTFSDDFFLKHPYQFIRQHMPFDPMWQCLSAPLTHQEFIEGHYAKTDSSGHYDFASLIDNHKQSGKLQQYQNAKKRIIANGVQNQLIQNKVDDYTRLITNENYNAAVDVLNDAVLKYNSYVELKNKYQQHSHHHKSELQDLLYSADHQTTKAQNILTSLNTSEPPLKKAISNALKQIAEMAVYLEKEKQYIRRMG